MSPKIRSSSKGKFIVMPIDEFEQLIENASERGAKKALQSVGLDDINAGIDIRDLRDLLRALRMAKKDAFKVFIRWLVIGVLTLITAGFLSIIGSYLK